MKRLILVGAALAAILAGPATAQDKILNASYDVARELFAQENAAFAPKYKAETGKDVTVDQSHAGTSKQARAIVEGLEADVVTFNQVTDIDFLVKNGFVSDDWQKRLSRTTRRPSIRFPSFLVRAGNPKGIKDWDDLVRDDVKVIFPNPKTSGNARYTYLAATAYAKETFDNDESQGEGVRHQALRQRAGVRHRRPRRDHHLRRARDRRRADHLRVRDARHRQGIRRGQVRASSRRRSACSPSSRSRSSTRWSTSKRLARRRQGLSRLPLHPGRPEDRRRERQPRQRRGGGRRSSRTSSPRSGW